MTSFIPGETIEEDQGDRQEMPRMTVSEAVTNFDWDRRYLDNDPDNNDSYTAIIAAFCERTKDRLGIDSITLTKDLESAMELAGETFNHFYSNDKEKRKLPFHNDTHAKITAVIGLQIFLGALDKMTENPDYADYFKKDPSLATKMAKTAAYGFAFHEYKDWWTTGQDSEKVKKWDEKLKKELDGRQVDTNDIGIIQELDSFTKNLTGSLITTFQKDFKPDFVGEDRVGEEISFVKGIDDPNFEVNILNALGASLRTADFAQTFNPNYQKKVILTDENGIVLSGEDGGRWGPFVLAYEMKQKRPKAMLKDWADRDEDGNLGKIHWENVGMSQFFYSNFVKPNINYGMEFMQQVNPKQYEGMKKAIKKIEKEFNH